MNPSEPPAPSPKAEPLTPGAAERAVEDLKGCGKYVIAIHGIGDQYQNATIQTVVSAFGRFSDYPAAVPLGGFRSEVAQGVSAFKLSSKSGGGKPAPSWVDDVGFVEIYWADIPREAQREGYIIEESKAWARTIVARLQTLYGQTARKLNVTSGKKRLRLTLHGDDYLAGADALSEMIETFAVLDNLLWVAEKAGVFKFDLDELLTRYLGDVQIVAEYPDYRVRILKKFTTVLDAIDQQIQADAPRRKAKSLPEPKIYFVAHSEGSVVAFMGLLKAMCAHGPDPALPAPPDWVNRVRGFMTIGSPIDKHLVMWPDLWDPVKAPHASLLAGPRAKIQWRNYYDYGDPVGFKLDSTRDWLKKTGWNHLFEFDGAKHDYGFGRYLLPGAAHNDYWTDDAVFGHFLESVVFPLEHPTRYPPPPSRLLPRISSYVLPYLLVALLIYTGCYLLYKAMGDYTAPDRATIREEQMTKALAAFSAERRCMMPAEGSRQSSRPPAPDIFLTMPAEEAQRSPLPPAADILPTGIWILMMDVTATTGLLLGTTLLARIPRLTRSPFWTVLAVESFGAGALIYALAGSPQVHCWHALQFFTWPIVQSCLPESALIYAEMASSGAMILVAAFIGGVAAWVSRHDLRRWPRGRLAWLRPHLAGARPLIYFGAIQVTLIVLYRIIWPAAADHHEHPLWPLLLAGAAFLYLWWLAVLLFDLVFVWHRYVRNSVAQDYLTALAGSKTRRTNRPRRRRRARRRIRAS